MRRLLVVGYHAAGSGLGNVVAGLKEGLSGFRQTFLLGLAPGQLGLTRAAGADGTFPVLGTARRHFRTDPALLRDQLEQLRPDEILLVGPALMGGPLLHQLQASRSQARLGLYLPVEGTLVGDEFGDLLRLVDACFVYTRDARAGIEALRARASAADPAFPRPLLVTAGHGFDAQHFFPLPGEERRRAARAAVFPGATELGDAFIVLNANRLSHRKRLDLTLAAFALFAAGAPDARLCLHTGRRSPEQNSEVRRLIAASGVGERIIMSPEPRDAVLPVERLNLLYNACDVGLSTSGGEGWGLGIFEHAATRAALVLPDHGSFAENWTGAAELVPAEGQEYVFYESAMIHVVAPDAVAGALDRLYRDPTRRTEMAERAFRRAHSPRWRWQSAAARIAAGFDVIAACATPSSPDAAADSFPCPNAA